LDTETPKEENQQGKREYDKEQSSGWDTKHSQSSGWDTKHSPSTKHR